jgi:hypothetical protein
MEQSGRKQWQRVANRAALKTAEIGEIGCRGLRPIAVTPNGKEGVDGSSPSEGFDFLPAQPPFPLSALAPLASFSVHRASTAWTSSAVAAV